MISILMRTLLCGFFVVLTCLSQPLMAAPTDLGALLDNLHTMRAEIIQTIYDNHGKAIETAYGNMALERPGQFRWEIKKPIPQLIIVNHATVTIYDPDLEQVVIRSLDKARGEGGALMLSEAHADIEKNYRVTPIKKDQPHWQWFSLTPQQQKNSMLVAIEIGFLDGKLQAMRLQDHLGHTTLIQFRHIAINAPLSSGLFDFKIPPKVDVIRENR